jgi:raffinose/stachyose/melibiose transport system permease protein
MEGTQDPSSEVSRESVIDVPQNTTIRFQLSAKRERYLSAYLMIFPGLILYTIFVIYPLIQGVWISFHRWDGFSPMQWIGLNNYGFALEDKVFLLALQHTIIFAVGVTVVKNVIALPLAVLLNQEIRGQTFFRTSVFLPVTMAFVAIGVLWSWIYNPTFGLLNSLLQNVGLGFLIRGWLSNPTIALSSIMVVDIWKWTGFHVVLFIAGLQSIPMELYEAALIDGANRWQSFIKITLPLLNQVIAVSVLLSLLGAFVSNYDVVYVMTGGGPNHATEVALTWIVNTALQFSDLGKASAMSIILFGLVLVVGIFQLFVMTRERHLM